MSKNKGFITGEDWTNEEIEILKEHYPYKKTDEILSLLPNRTKKSIYGMANYLGITKSDFKKRNRWNIESVRQYFEENNCKLISTEYKNNKIPLDYICQCGNPSAITLIHFLKGVRCQKCAGNERLTIEKVREVFESEGCNLVSEEYINNETELDYICVCGRPAKTTYDVFTRGCRCNECKKDKLSRENNWNWNPDKTDEERLYGRSMPENREWIRQVKERDNWTCQCCGHISNGDIVAHHLNGYHWAIEERFLVENGVTLCEPCHKEFHSIYGIKWNTTEQFQDFLNNKHICKEVS